MFFSTNKVSTASVEPVETQAFISLRNWFKKMIERGKIEMFSVVREVTPELAALMLEGNTDNRTLTKTRVQRFATIMLEKRWLLISQGISFSKSGELINGQHRLNGVIVSGVTVQMNITFGEHRDAKMVTDTGKPRSGADVLGMGKFKSATNLAAAARLVWMIEKGAARGAHTIENDALVTFVKRRPLLVESVNIGMNTWTALKCSPAGLAAAHYLITKKHPVEAELFFDTLKDGGTGARTVIGKLRDKLMRDRPAAVEAAALIIKAWNHHANGRLIKQLVWRRAVELFPGVE